MRIRYVTLALLALLLSACESLPNTNPSPTAVTKVNTELLPLLEAHTWSMISTPDRGEDHIAPLFQGAEPITLRFSDARVSITGACNLRSASFQLAASAEGDELRFGRLLTTLMACPPELKEVDDALIKLFANPLLAQVGSSEPRHLFLRTQDKDILAFIGTPTPDFLYGAPIQQFYEVAATTVPCAGAQEIRQCLQVRERFYDENGRKIDPIGAWQIFHSAIEGFTHQPGERTVLRVKRYTRPSSPALPADASAFVYVLDMKVESESCPTRFAKDGC